MSELNGGAALESFDWNQLKSMGGESGQLPRRIPTVPLDSLSEIDAAARPDLASQVLPSVHSPEGVLDELQAEARDTYIRELIDKLPPDQQAAVRARMNAETAKAASQELGICREALGNRLEKAGKRLRYQARKAAEFHTMSVYERGIYIPFATTPWEDDENYAY